MITKFKYPAPCFVTSSDLTGTAIRCLTLPLLYSTNGVWSARRLYSMVCSGQCLEAGSFHEPPFADSKPQWRSKRPGMSVVTTTVLSEDADAADATVSTWIVYLLLPTS